MPYLPGQVQPVAVLLHLLHDPEALRAVTKSRRAQRVQLVLADVAERSVPEVVPKRHRLGQVLVEVQGPRDRPGDLGHLQRVGQAGDEMIAQGRYEHLRLVLETPERLRVDDPVPIALELGAKRRRRLGTVAAPALRRPGGVGRQRLLSLLQVTAYRGCYHGVSRLSGAYGDNWPERTEYV